MIYDVKQISDHIWTITEVDSVILYLIVGSEKALLIDTGYGYGDLKSIIKGITDLPLMIVLTHGHIDHIAGNYQFQDIWLSKQDKPIMLAHFNEERKGNLAYRFKKMPYLMEVIDKDKYLSRSIEHVNFHDLQIDMIIDLDGIKLKVVDLKGHSFGSVGFYDESNGYLFTGDAISLHNIWMFQKDSLSLIDYRNTLINLATKITNKDIKIFPAHGEIALAYDVVEGLIACTDEILHGINLHEDLDFEMFGTKGKKHIYHNVSIIYGDKQ